MAVTPIPIIGKVRVGSREYFRLHMRIRRLLGPAKECEVCGISEISIDWANISGEYSQDGSDYAALCKPCHRLFDGHTGIQRAHCIRGHLKVGDNIIVIARKNRRTIEYGCRKCYSLRRLKWQTQETGVR